VLVFAYGNPSRGDDALGPLFLERVAALTRASRGIEDIELLTDFQLQVEHALDLMGREQVVFVDASVSCRSPFKWQTIAPAHDCSYSSHVMTPAALLQAFVDVMGKLPPPSYLISIRGYQFELGQPLSAAAAAHLEQALAFFQGWLEKPAD
jgi:hydrogenase maturation protease